MPEGAFFWGTVTRGEWTGPCLWIKIPYTADHHSWHCIAVYQAGDPEPDHGWQWNGDHERPTLTPSIACGPPNELDWHGFLRFGMLVAVNETIHMMRDAGSVMCDVPSWTLWSAAIHEVSCPECKSRTPVGFVPAARREAPGSGGGSRKR